jgi:hypothetical protein
MAIGNTKSIALALVLLLIKQRTHTRIDNFKMLRRMECKAQCGNTFNGPIAISRCYIF